MSGATTITVRVPEVLRSCCEGAARLSLAASSVRAVVANACPGEALHSVILTLGHHHHVILPSRRSADRYLYLVLDRDEATFGLLLHRLSEADAL